MSMVGTGGPILSWVTVAWSMVAAFCLTLFLAHFLIGLRQRSAASLYFSVSCLAAAAIAAFELAMMRAGTPAAWGTTLRWFHVANFVLHASLVLFVRQYFSAGRLWLAVAVIAVRGTASLLVNFVRSPNLNFVEITGLRHVQFLGESVALPDGILSRWTRLGELSSILLFAFLMDATITVWRRGERRAAAVGLACAFWVAFAASHNALVHAGVVSAPYLISFPYMAIVAVMGYELSRDILRASELESALRESDRRLALAAEAASLDFWSWDVKNDEVWMTPRARELRGYGPEERLQFDQLLSKVHPEDREGLRSALAATARGGGLLSHEYRIVRPDGDIRWIAVRGSSGRDGPDHRLRVLGATMDVTSRKLAQIEAAQHEAELAHLSRVNLLGELSVSLAHEINQPLTSILSSAQAGQKILENHPGTWSDEMSEIFDDIVQENRQATEVIRRLRNLLKKGEIRSEPLDLPELVEDVLRLARTQLLRCGASVTAEIPENLPRVRGDRVQIAQVLLNLFTNGCDAMAEAKPGERRLAVRVAHDGNGMLDVAVADRGCGISGEVERVFEPFVTTKPNGLGLGLPICRTIIAAHGGRLWAVNNQDGGATFHFTVPVVAVGRA